MALTLQKNDSGVRPADRAIIHSIVGLLEDLEAVTVGVFETIIDLTHGLGRRETDGVDGFRFFCHFGSGGRRHRKN